VQASARAHERARARGVVAVRDEHGVDPGAARGQPGTGVERVAAVVARADEEQHARARDVPHDLAQHRAGRHRDRRGGPRHQGALGQLRHGPGLEPADGRDRQGDGGRARGHDDSATT
jgi:hypothetical protein